MQRPTWPRQVRNRLRVAGGLEISPATPGDVLFMTWLLCEREIFFIFCILNLFFGKLLCAPEQLRAHFRPKWGRWVYDGGGLSVPALSSLCAPEPCRLYCATGLMDGMVGCWSGSPGTLRDCGKSLNNAGMACPNLPWAPCVFYLAR